MPRPIITLLLIVFAVGSASAAASRQVPGESWGKTGVTLQQYRQDAADCTAQGYFLDISQTEDAKAFAEASRQLDSEVEMGPDPYRYQSIVHATRPDVRYQNIKSTLQATVDQCLAARGYSKFRLTEEQRHHLEKLKLGSDERRAYLYGLATDPAVLHGQKLDTMH
jgi:hypothetical protein